jgi:hypothetical protein
MAREIMKGLEVTMFWPGTGTIDPTERAALKDFFTNGISAWTWDVYKAGSGGATMARAEFISDVSNTADPCGGDGNVSSRLDGVTCIGGHIVGLYLHFFGGAHLHSVPASAGAFKHLKSFFYSDFIGSTGASAVVRFDAAIGNNWGQLKSFIYCGQNSIPNQELALPSSMGLWRNMTMIQIHSMDISGAGFPSGIFASPVIEVVRLNSVPLQALPSVASMTALSVFILANNGINGPMPSFKGLSNLSSISFLGNKLTGGTMDSFDGCSSLKDLALKANALSCDLFSLIGCTSLTKIDASQNQLKGKIPPSWSALTKVETVKLSRNNIGGVNQSSLSPVSGMKSLIDLDISHNIMELEREGCNLYDRSGCPGGGNTEILSQWVASFLTSNVKRVDISHNHMTMRGGVVSVLRDIAPRFPSLVSFKANHNRLGGLFAMGDICANADFSHNEIYGIFTNGWGVYQTGTAVQQADFSSVKINNQRVTFQGFEETFQVSGIIPSFDDAINSTVSGIDFSGSPFVPSSLGETKKVEYPAGSKIFPFSCPIFVGREFPELVFDLDAAMYGYSGGSTPELRRKWISSADTSDYKSAFFRRFVDNASNIPGVGFCTCNPPWTGVPPNCVYACGKERMSIAELNASGATDGESQCEACMTGTTCDEPVNDIRTLRLNSRYWRASWKSRDVKQCPRSELCTGGPNSLDYCIEHHHGPFCKLCVKDYFVQGDKCMACADATAHSPASIALMVAVAISVCVLAAYKLSAAFRKRAERIPWRSVVVKGKVLVIFFQIALMIPNVYGIPYPSIYLGQCRSKTLLFLVPNCVCSIQACSTCFSS